MKIVKRCISILISFTMFISIIISSISAVSAKKYDGFIYKVKNNKAIITGYDGKEIDLVIPSEIEGKKVVEIDDYAFSQSSFRYIEIPSTVKSIGRWVYNGLDEPTDIKLEKLILHEGIEYVGEWAFGYCQNLKNVKIPKSVKYIDEGAFGVDDGDEWGYWTTNKFILDCYKGTEGEKYAKRMTLDYRLIDEKLDVIHQSIGWSSIYNKHNERDTYEDYSYYEGSMNFFKRIYNYTGKQIKPISHIKLRSPIDGKLHKINKNNYEIKYKNNTNVGFAKAIIKGRNNCYGKTVVYFRIGPPKTKVKSVKKLGGGYINIKWNKTKKTTGYKIKYSANNGKSYKTARIIKNSVITSQTIKLNTNKTYLIKVTPYYRVTKSSFPDKVFFNGYEKKRFNTINSRCKNTKKITL